MTVCATETAGPAFTIAADGSYAARLAGEGEARFPERWTLDGPEPYAVPLPLDQPEEADSEVLPLTDGRVLIHRRVAERHAFALLYPTGSGGSAGPRTGELALGGIEAREEQRVTLLPPAPDGRSAYALVAGGGTSTVWRVAGGTSAPERVAELAGSCSGGVWLDRAGRMLALDRETGGRVKAVSVDLGRAGEVSPLLQITERSDDRLLLADPDSGLLLIRSDAPGEPRLGWGVLGSARPVRFPECLRAAGSSAVPFAVQPGQALMPESCAVALRLGGDAGAAGGAGADRDAGAAGGTGADRYAGAAGDVRLGLWRPSEKRLFELRAPVGWLGGAGLWTRDGLLRLPYATGDEPCGVLTATMPQPAPQIRVMPTSVPAQPSPLPAPPAAPRPVPLQQAPLTGR
ncbi:hypothetical protein [Streptomyces sp. NPDC086023]|uniref:hypothetical protein n=1 Tax=Streptomyces sp. NPDC086023 TaxID=3365746 RepID=UPI0037D25A7D